MICRYVMMRTSIWNNILHAHGHRHSYVSIPYTYRVGVCLPTGGTYPTCSTFVVLVCFLIDLIFMVITYICLLQFSHSCTMIRMHEICTHPRVHTVFLLCLDEFNWSQHVSVVLVGPYCGLHLKYISISTRCWVWRKRVNTFSLLLGVNFAAHVSTSMVCNPREP